jgi:hypothetical protein
MLRRMDLRFSDTGQASVAMTSFWSGLCGDFDVPLTSLKARTRLSNILMPESFPE